jgi:hypothetical protein
VIHLGATRAVLLLGPWAIKFVRLRHGIRCNWHEADLFRRNKNKEHRRLMLCPVLWCSRPAIVLIMRRAATPITQVQIDELKARFWKEWDYLGLGDDGHPFEWKLSDWGVLDERLVAVDYGVTK